MKNYYTSRFVYETRKDAQHAYDRYLVNHFSNIEKAFSKYAKPLTNYTGANIDVLYELIATHDRSKLTDMEEYMGYLINFYPYKGDGIPLDAYGVRRSIYEKALLAHYRHNPHHPEYWILINDNSLVSTPMDKIYVCEMILDWVANQVNDEKPVKQFWKDNRSYKMLHPDTINLIDELINLIDDNDDDLELLSMENHKEKTESPMG